MNCATFCREVKLPGKDSKSPQSFPFGTPYVEIRDFLARQNEALFRRNSVLGLLERDATTKRAPERWQSLESEDVASFDAVVCFESRVFDLVVEGTLFFVHGVESCFSQCCRVNCYCCWSWSCRRSDFDTRRDKRLRGIISGRDEKRVCCREKIKEQGFGDPGKCGGWASEVCDGLPIEMYMLLLSRPYEEEQMQSHPSRGTGRRGSYLYRFVRAVKSL